jgi:hypothetical protein
MTTSTSDYALMAGRSARMNKKCPLQELNPNLAIAQRSPKWKAWRIWGIWMIGLLLTSFSLTACGGGRTIEWKQEVRLHDGRVIVIDRVSKQTGKIFPENTIIEYEKTLTFTHPDTGERIRWTLPKGTGAWMLDFDGEIPYYVLLTSSVADYNDWGCPNPPPIVFRYEQRQWSRIPIEQLPTRFVKPNLLLAAKTDQRSSNDRYVTVEEIDAYFKRQDLPYRIISREKVSPIAKGCHPDVLVKQGRQMEININYNMEVK